MRKANFEEFLRNQGLDQSEKTIFSNVSVKTEIRNNAGEVNFGIFC